MRSLSSNFHKLRYPSLKWYSGNLLVYPNNYCCLDDNNRRMEEEMTYSQINHAKAWGFSRRTPNLNLSFYEGRLLPKSLREFPLNEQQGKDLFEYSVFGNSEQKIGNFTHIKMLRTFLVLKIQRIFMQTKLEDTDE
jgi:hypothetical protein